LLSPEICVVLPRDASSRHPISFQAVARDGDRGQAEQGLAVYATWYAARLAQEAIE
jgi:hypothetical protein